MTLLKYPSLGVLVSRMLSKVATNQGPLQSLFLHPRPTADVFGHRGYGFGARWQRVGHGATSRSVIRCSQPHVPQDHTVVSFTPSFLNTVRFRPITSRTTTKKQKISVPRKPAREEAIRNFWWEVRGVTNAAFLHRFQNFGRVFPRYRDMKYLPRVMEQWDRAIMQLFEHDRGMEVANNMARRHPFILNARVAANKWAINAVKGRLPAYDWEVVLKELIQDTGTTQEVLLSIPRGGRRQSKLYIREPGDGPPETWRMDDDDYDNDDDADEGGGDGTQRGRQDRRGGDMDGKDAESIAMSGGGSRADNPTSLPAPSPSRPAPSTGAPPHSHTPATVPSSSSSTSPQENRDGVTRQVPPNSVRASVTSAPAKKLKPIFTEKKGGQSRRAPPKTAVRTPVSTLSPSSSSYFEAPSPVARGAISEALTQVLGPAGERKPKVGKEVPDQGLRQRAGGSSGGAVSPMSEGLTPTGEGSSSQDDPWMVPLEAPPSRPEPYPPPRLLELLKQRGRNRGRLPAGSPPQPVKGRST